MTKCLGVDEYLGDALDLLITEGLLMQVDRDANECDEGYEYENPYQLLERADILVTRCKDDPMLLVTNSSFEWLEGSLSLAPPSPRPAGPLRRRMDIPSPRSSNVS